MCRSACGVTMMLKSTELHRLLHYNPETGVFTWRVNRSRLAKAGSVAGTINSQGYVSIMVNRKLYLAHRLAFLYMTGSFPVDQVDHINRLRADNRWINLRPCNNSQNHRNRTGEVKGYTYWKKRYVAQGKANGMTVYLGRYRTKLAAAYAFHAFSVSLGIWDA